MKRCPHPAPYTTKRLFVTTLATSRQATDHTALTEDRFYTEEVDGEPLLDWGARLIEGEPVTDVHCTECSVS